jgi:thiol:disulfide interchange protein
MDEQIIHQIFDELLASLEPLETQNAALLQFLKSKGIATDDELAPFFEQAANTASIRWRAVRVRTNALLTSALKSEEQPVKVPDKSQPTAEPSAEAKQENPSEEKTQKEAGRKPEDRKNDVNQETKRETKADSQTSQQAGEQSNRQTSDANIGSNRSRQNQDKKETEHPSTPSSPIEAQKQVSKDDTKAA